MSNDFEELSSGNKSMPTATMGSTGAGQPSSATTSEQKPWAFEDGPTHYQMYDKVGHTGVTAWIPHGRLSLYWACFNCTPLPV